MDLSKLSNLSLYLRKPRDLYYEEKPIPSLDDPHDALVAVRYTGVCGSDIHLWDHGGVRGGFAQPFVLGHESSGTVVAVGAQVTGLHVGDRVALEPGRPCRRCRACLGGRYNLCPSMEFAAAPPCDGTLTGVFRAPAEFCHVVPDTLSLREAALIEPLAVAVHIVRLARVGPGQSVVVMGAGPVGLLCGAVAREFGAGTVVSTDVVDMKLAFAAGFCATHTYQFQSQLSSDENGAAILRLAGRPGGVDAAIDASGFEASIRTCLSVVRAGGTFVQGGMGKTDISFPIMKLCMKEVTARGSFRYSGGDYALAIELASSGRVEVGRLISDIVAFRDAEQAYQKVRAGQAIKVLITGPNEAAEQQDVGQM